MTCLRICIATLSILLLISNNVKSEHYYTLNSDDGLPSNTVWCVHQDENGILWFGTTAGISRYDGSQFYNLNVKDGLVSNSITSIEQFNSKQLVAISYRAGINKINTDSLQVESAIQNQSWQNSICIKKDKIYSITGNSVLQTNRSLTEISFPIEKKDAKTLFCDSNNNILVGSKNGLFTYSLKKGYLPFLTSEHQNETHSVYKDEAKNYWIGQTGQLLKVDKNNEIKIYKKGFPKDGIVHRVLKDSNNTIWLSITNYGLYKLKNDEAIFVGDKYGIGKTNINYLYKDKQGNIWIATFGKGLICIPKSSFISYTESNGLPKNVTNNIVYHPNLQGFLIASFDGLYFFKNDEFLEIESNFFLSNNAKKTSNYNFIYNVAVDADNQIYFFNKLYHEEEIKKSTFQNIPVLATFEFCQLPASKNIIARVNKNTKQVIHSKDNFKHDLPFNYQNLNTVFCDYKGRYWINSSEQGINGIQMYNDGKSIYFYHQVENYPDALTKGKLLSLAQIKDTVYLGTNIGLIEYKNGDFFESELNSQLNGISIKALVADKQDGLWIGTTNGLCYSKKNQLKHFTTENGLVSNEINCLALNNNDSLLVGTNAGISLLGLKDDLLIDTLYTPFNINSISTNKQKFNAFDEIVIDPNEELVKINFSAINYTKKSSNDFSYSLSRNNENENWHKTDKNFVTFNSLKGGKYTFSLKVKDEFGIWGKPKIIDFEILIPWWKKPISLLFALCFGLFFIGAILYTILQKQNERRQREIAIQAKINTLEQQALTAMMNPHFIFNSLNSMQYLFNSGQKLKANSYLSKFAHLIRLNISLTGKSTTTLAKELQRAQLYVELEKMRFGESIIYSVDKQIDIDTEQIVIPSMIIQPLIENAIIHGLSPKNKTGKINLEVSRIADNGLSILIEDDGIGISKSKALKKENFTGSKHKSKGLKVTKERIDMFCTLHNHTGGLQISNPDSTPTKIHILLPLVYEKLVNATLDISI